MNGIEWRRNYTNLRLPADEDLTAFVVMGMTTDIIKDGLDTHCSGVMEPLYVTDCGDYAVEFKKEIEENTTYKCYIVRCPMYLAPKSAIFECM